MRGMRQRKIVRLMQSRRVSNQKGRHGDSFGDDGVRCECRTAATRRERGGRQK